MMGEVLCLIDLNSFFFFLQIWVYSVSFFFVCSCEERGKKITEIIQNDRRRRDPPPSFTGGCLTSILCVSLNEAFQHRDAVTSCTARKHCRIAPYRSLILNVPVFSQLLKFVCWTIFTLWDVKCTFFCFYSPHPQESPHHFKTSITVVLSEPFYCVELSWDEEIE